VYDNSIANVDGHEYRKSHNGQFPFAFPGITGGCLHLELGGIEDAQEISPAFRTAIGF
jgi:hypothetical protein